MITLKIINVNGESMFPTLFNRDKLIIKNVLKDKYKKNEIIVFNKKIFISKFLIKRIVAITDDKILIKNNGDIYINNKYIFNDKQLKYNFKIIPKNCIFVIGDNYKNSIDSRYNKIGIIHLKFIFGKILTKIYPFERIGVV